MNAVFVKLVNMSVAAGWLILAVLVLRLLLKKAPRWITCLLWAMVAVRLVCPISLQSPVSAYQVAAPTAVQKSGQVEYFHYVYESGDKPSIQLDVDAIRPAEAIPAQPQTTPEQSAAAEPVQETAGRSDPTRYLPPLVTVWLAVGGALLLYGLGSTLRLRLRVREAMRLRDNIWVCDAVTSPFLLGLFRPRVYLPSGMDGAQLDYVLAHEQAHLRRGDHVWKPLGYVLLAAHWFNPLVWLAYWLFCRDIETACDQCVVRRLDRNEKKAYSDALLQCSQGRRMVLACPVAFGEEGVKSRIKAVLQYKKPAFWVILAAIIACIVVAVCFLTDPVSGGSKGTLTFVEKENIISTWRADFTVDTQEAALDANIYAEIWQNGQCRTTQLLTMSRYVNELSVQLTQPERNEQMRLTFSLWAATDAYGGYGDLSDDLKQMPKDTAFAAYTDGEKRQAAAGDDIVLLAVAADLGGGLPEFDCRKLEKQPDIARNADYMIVVHAAFTPSDTTPPENILGYDTESAHALLASEFRLPTEVDIVEVPEPDTVGQGFFQLASDNRWIARYGKAELTGSTPSITLHSWSSGTLTVESGTDALLWINREANAAYTGDMTGDEIISALSGWAWQMKKNIARSKEAVPDAATFFTRFPDGGFRWDIYGQNSNDSGALVSQLTDYVKGNNLTVEQCRALLLNIDGLDGAYAEGYTGTLLAVYQKEEAVYTQAWQSLTTDQQRAIPRDAEGLLPRPPITVSVAPNGYPLMAEKVEQAVRQLDMPLAISPNETYSAEEHHINYTLRGSDGAALPLCGVNSSVRDGDKGVLRVTYVEEAGEGASFRWEDWQKPIQLAGLLCGGFTDEEQFYRQLSSREIPEDAAVNGAEWQLETADGHFCHVRYSAAVSATGTALPKTLMVSFYDSEATYRENWKEAMQNREANRIDQLVLMGQAKQGN